MISDAITCFSYLEMRRYELVYLYNKDVMCVNNLKTGKERMLLKSMELVDARGAMLGMYIKEGAHPT